MTYESWHKCPLCLGIPFYNVFYYGTMEQVMTKTLVINSFLIYYQFGKW